MLESRANGGGVQPSDTAGQAIGALETRQQELMGVQSSDGRPPSRSMGRTQWRWFAVFAAAALVIAGGWLVIADVGGRAMLLGGVLVILLLVAGAPVWVAGLLRGKEERAALREARVEHRAKARRR